MPENRRAPGSAIIPAALNRRRFLSACVLLSAGGLFHLPAATAPRYRAAIIGHTARGNYGHDLDLIFGHRQDVQVVAVADPNPAGRARARERSKAIREYEDYRDMLEREKPDLVSVAPRWTDQHHAMARASLQAGAHVYLEKPITKTLAEADELLTLASSKGLKIAVAHQMRMAPNIPALKAALETGWVGDLLEIRAHGKQDRRAGGEDLIVLGVHLFDFMRYFGGNPTWCSARILENGQDIAPSGDAPHISPRQPTENIGPVVGTEIFAQFAFPQGLHGTFVSSARRQQSDGPWGMELVGSKGVIKIEMEMLPRILCMQPAQQEAPSRTFAWRPWAADPTLAWPEAERTFLRANARVVDDWLEAIAQNREPVCSRLSGMRALELAHAVFAAGLSGARVTLPLECRHHPLEPIPR